MSQLQQLKQYIDEETRNRIVFTQNVIPDLSYSDVGWVIASWLDKKNEQNFHLDSSIISKVFQSGNVNGTIGKYTALENIGILFEPDLRLDLHNIFESNSKNQCLIITSDGIVDNNKERYYFQTNESPYTIALSGLSFLTLQ